MKEDKGLASHAIRHNFARWVALGGALWGIAITLAILLLPILPFCRSTRLATGSEFTECSTETLFQTQESQLQPVTWIFLTIMAGLSVGSGVAALYALDGQRGNGALVLVLAILLTIGMLLSVLSIGVYYLPAVLLLLIGGAGMFLSKETDPEQSRRTSA